MASQGGAINFAAAAKSDSRDSPLKEVQVDGSVLLKIQKHCKDAQPNLVTGLMLGLDVGVRLEVTSCFPHASGDDDGDDDAYQLEMMRCLRELNVDNNIVGWYQSATLGSYHTVELIDTFISYWDSIKRAVCIVYDPQRSGNGGIAIKAVKVADTFISIYQAAMKAGAPLTAEKLRGSGVSWHDVFQELPVKVSNGTLTCALMAELEPEAPATQCDFDRLSLSVAPTLEGNLLLLNGCIDDIVAEQGKVSEYHNKLRRQQQQQQQWLQKRKQENMQRKAAGEEPLPEEDPVLFKPVVEHSQLVTYLLSNQVSNYCDQIGTFSRQGLRKLQLMEGLHSTH